MSVYSVLSRSPSIIEFKCLPLRELIIINGGEIVAMMTRLSNDNPALSDDQFKKTVDDSDVDDISVTGVAKL